MEDIVYVIKCEEEILFLTQDANKAIQKSIYYIKDQHEHELEIWFEGSKIGIVDLNGRIQNI